MCRKKFILLPFLMVLSIFMASAQYRVELAVFEHEVEAAYFKNLENVQFVLDQNSLYRYYLGNFEEEATAVSTKEKVLALGFKYARVVDMEKEKELCSANCAFPLYLHNIFFEFDKATLIPQSIIELDNLVKLLQDNPSYQVELAAHTDSKGTPAYNVGLSERRAISSKKYLQSKNILANRVIIKAYGETSPVAKNEIDGQDNPIGRQFNRRVDFNVIDGSGKIISELFKPISPDFLDN